MFYWAQFQVRILWKGTREVSSKAFQNPRAMYDMSLSTLSHLTMANSDVDSRKPMHTCCNPSFKMARTDTKGYLVELTCDVVLTDDSALWAGKVATGANVQLQV